MFIQHGGRFHETNTGGEQYYGGKTECRSGLDTDFFGYFDLIDEVKKLGYESWENIWCKELDSNAFSLLEDDNDVLSMLSQLTPNRRHIRVYVEGDKKPALSIGEGNMVVGEETAHKLGATHEASPEVQRPTKKSKGKEKLTDNVKGKGKEKVVETVRETVNEKVRDKFSDKHTKKVTKKVSESIDELMTEKITEKVNEKESEKVSERQVDRVTESERVQLNDQVSEEESDDDYVPRDGEETEDSLSDRELADEDEEYMSSRRDIRIDRDTFNDIGRCIAATIDDEAVDDQALAISEYEDSTDGNCPYESDEESDGEKNRVRKVTYDPRCDHKRLEIELGMRFASGKQCRDALTTKAICEGWNLHFSRVGSRKCEARCEDPCNWRCYGSVVEKEGTFVIKYLTSKPHTCRRRRDNLLVSSNWIARQYLNVFRMRQNFTIDDLRADICERYGTEPKANRLYKAKSLALETLRGSVTAHYAKLRSYLAEMMTSDPEGKFELLCSEGAIFRGLYIGFSSLVKGFKAGCRPIIGLDGCFLKTHLGGILLCAVSKDGNNQMYPLAWAVVEVENEENWKWFIERLMEQLGTEQGGGYTFISDQQKGLTKSLADLAPMVEHRNCARHAYANWNKKNKGIHLKNMFWSCVRSTYLEEWQMAVDEMRKENEQAYLDFMEREPAKFCKAFISTHCKCDMVDNNISETFNGYIVKSRGKHIITMCEEIRCYVMERQYKKLSEAGSMKDTMCFRIRKTVEELKFKSRYCDVHPAVGGLYEVHLYDDKFIVSLEEKVCSCRSWELSGIPCLHATAAIMYMKEGVEEYVHDYYSIERYKRAYENGIKPLRGEKMWPHAEGWPVQPPAFSKRAGRPKKKRVREHNEKQPTNPNKLRRFGLVMTCKNCWQKGHNTRGCKNEKCDPPAKEKRRRGRPAKAHSEAQSSQVTGTETSSLTNASSAPNPPNPRAPTSLPLQVKKTIAKERALARKGIGTMVTESWNIYFRGSSNQKGSKFINPRKVSELPNTQESGNDGV
ncbi:uncharacterized protein LOC130994774 [Salvia miltiorrhiza]|uniref:uncharacterized protein LOC130994774 n=1 Tax=Salvia miltiorrhiza TaxID=226208 RepID=UPI0025AC9279|nr:uncharacterized protein LOC130994774 [Salvia miltiorrhiza]